MKSKIEIYILVAIILALSSYIIFRKDENINYKIPTISNIKEAEISKIVFNELEINKVNNNWILPSGFKVSENSISRILKQITNLEIIDKISESNNLKPFGLDSAKKLEVYNNNNIVLTMDIGKTSTTGNYTYISLPHETTVYSVRGDISELFGTGEDSLRSKEVLTISDNDEVTITQKDISVVKKASEDPDIYNLLKSVKASNFKVLPRKDILLSIAISGKEDKSLIIFEPVENEYPATSSDVDFVFTLPEYFVNKLKDIK